MGFYNIMLEGEQAEEYKARKEKEAQTAAREKFKQYDNRYNNNGTIHTTDREGNCHTYMKSVPGSQFKDTEPIGDDGIHLMSSDDIRRDHAAKLVAARNSKEKVGDVPPKRDLDAINRHMRRHPDQWDGDKRIKTRSEACGIFESVEFLNESKPEYHSPEYISNAYIQICQLIDELKPTMNYILKSDKMLICDRDKFGRYPNKEYCIKNPKQMSGGYCLRYTDDDGYSVNHESDYLKIIKTIESFIKSKGFKRSESSGDYFVIMENSKKYDKVSVCIEVDEGGLSISIYVNL